jgi:hypothetical protein
MCAACEAYDEVIEVLQRYELNNSQGIQLLSNLIATFTQLDPVNTIILLAKLNGHVLDRLVPDETVH